MSFSVTIEPGQHRFAAETSETVLDAALRQGLTMPYGCRNGACGACKGKVVSGEVDHGKTQPHALTEAEKAQGLALFCCASARSDLVLECKEVRSASDIPVKTLPARVAKMERLAPDVMAISLQLPATERFLFLTGQYIDILLKDGKRRSFSLANAPHDDALLQLHIRLVPGGLFTEHVFNGMKEKDILRLNGPHGTFFLREESAKPMILLAGGTGFAPIKSIVEHALFTGSKRPMTLYWGNRNHSGLYLDELPRRWAAEHPQLTYVPVLSEPAPEDGWTGRQGLVHEAVMADFPDLSGHQVYVCGAPAMVEAARQDFIARCQLPEEEFFADSFTFTS